MTNSLIRCDNFCQPKKFSSLFLVFLRDFSGGVYTLPTHIVMLSCF